MGLFKFNRPEANPILRDNQLTKSLRLNEQSDFHDSGRSFDRCRGANIISHLTGLAATSYGHNDLFQDMDPFFKAPGK